MIEAEIGIALLLGFVQGVTEFLPISSTAHLHLVAAILEKSLNTKEAVALHAATLIAVTWALRGGLARMAASLARTKRDENTRFFVCLVIATLPIIPIGALVHTQGWLNAIENNPDLARYVIATTTIAFGLALPLADRLGGHKGNKKLSLPAMAIIGATQCLALMPGVSRAGIIITTARCLGLSRTQAAKLAVWLAIPTIIGAASLATPQLLQAPLISETTASLSLGALALAFTIATLTACATIRLWLKHAERINYWPFALYRVALGIALLAL